MLRTWLLKHLLRKQKTNRTLLIRALNLKQIELAQMMGMDIVAWVDTYAKKFGELYTKENKDKPTDWFLEQLRGPLN